MEVTSITHGAPLGEDEIKASKTAAGFDGESKQYYEDVLIGTVGKKRQARREALE